jgi:hypothetical protein
MDIFQHTRKCKVCRETKPIKQFKTNDSDCTTDTCYVCCSVMEKVRGLIQKKEHNELTDIEFLFHRNELFRINGIPIYE